MKQKRFLSVLMCFTILITLFQGNAQAATTITSNQSGIQDGYNYELWKDSGNTSMTLNSGGTFSCQWSNINNALFRKGKKFNETQTHQQIGNLSVNYSADYSPNGNSYLCIYGWTSNPLVEYYIVDSWGTWRPPGALSKGTINVDGGTYDIYETTRTNQPSIKGIATFKQYWSVRTSKRTSGTISVSEHFKAWERLGMSMGKMYEVSLTVEGYQSSGSASVTSNNISIGGSGG
ncbi:1,4-beta-xylanase [Anaerosacchariphilus polymeriproducens]|uniref:Endo-1,4-beta-xylanase n=2 Tax=Anaerosacchariphilus polymeriproducens TaxID=1812858 RepID=A0A371AUB0_9FIRM|nr:1,4-beta-xylanase [Anaerosacchariphilus polymeriproducens]